MPTDAEDDAMRHEAAGRLRAMAAHHRPDFRSMLLGVAGWMEYVSNFDDPAEHARASASARALLGATDTTVDSGPGAVRDRSPDPRAVDFDRCPEPPIDERIGATDTTPPEPAPMPEFPTNDDRICANAIAEALARRYGHVLLSLCYRSARQVMDVCGEWAAAADAREAAGTAELYGDELTAHDQAIGIYDDQTPRPRNHNALTITTLPKPVTGECSCGASAQFDFEGEADAWWTGHRQAEGIPGDEWGEWCPVHREEMQDHDCDLVDTTEEPTDAS